MAIKEVINEGDEIEVDDENPSYDDLLCAFQELHKDIEKLLKRNNILKNENSSGK